MPLFLEISAKTGFISKSSSLSITFRIYDIANMGSMPLELPAIRLIVPVGAIVVTVAFLIGASLLS
ncbi:MAG: hypothetical protein AMQ22_02129 [Candidatus Methanofastidiosum methylothiophilum]|uniref:Uncharacterized protein n=1 Tax=Candidatus Methanofastidiosum methylothiophilum TaxID=1705564 RepID=A0A150IN75_9EURY|nr:MAG: hypothetical protein AMQ22_02129 [Candidatus Methanofastidiosum methylthiophilus]